MGQGIMLVERHAPDATRGVCGRRYPGGHPRGYGVGMEALVLVVLGVAFWAGTLRTLLGGPAGKEADGSPHEG